MRQFCLHCDKELPEPTAPRENFRCENCDAWYETRICAVALTNTEPKPTRFKEFALGAPFHISILLWVEPEAVNT